MLLGIINMIKIPTYMDKLHKHILDTELALLV